LHDRPRDLNPAAYSKAVGMNGRAALPLGAGLLLKM